MKTSIITMSNGKNTIKLIGTVHVGSVAYYDAVKSHISGEKVLFEGVKKSEGIDLENISKMYTVFAKALGFTTQKEQYDEMCKQENYINADIEAADIFEFASKDSKLRKIMSESESFEYDEKTINVKIIRNIIMVILKLTYIMQFFTIKKDRHLVVDLRNYIALHKAIQESRNCKEISMIYGEGHIRGMRKFLQKCGFVVTSKIKLSMTM